MLSDVTWPPAPVAMTRARPADPVRSVTLMPSQAVRAIFCPTTVAAAPTPDSEAEPESDPEAAAVLASRALGPTTSAEPLPAAGDDVASDPAKAEPWRALSPKGIAAAITSTTTATTARNRRREGG